MKKTQLKSVPNLETLKIVSHAPHLEKKKRLLTHQQVFPEDLLCGRQQHLGRNWPCSPAWQLRKRQIINKGTNRKVIYSGKNGAVVDIKQAKGCRVASSGKTGIYGLVSES